MNDIDGIGDHARRMIAKSKWHPITSAPEGVEVETKIEDGRGSRNQQCLKRQGPALVLSGHVDVRLLRADALEA